MVNRWFNPNPEFADATGAALSGAQLFFYAAGTSTKQNTYSDKALTIANSNPVVLGADGRSPNPIYFQNLAYKVVLAPSTDTDPPTSPIWTEDNVWTSDYSTVAQVQGVNGNPNGQLAGTQASATIPASMAWDYTNNILYVCTSTGTSVTAVWTAVNNNSVGTVLPTPQGRLTLTNNVPVISSDATAATTVYYTPYTGVLCPIYNGTTFIPINFASQLSLGLVAAHAASQIYDLYLFLLNGVATLGSGPSWSAGSGGSVTAGSCARGTGAGGAALSLLQGILTNAVSMTITYGPSGATTTVAANKATYVGSMFMDTTNGQVSCYISAGQNRKWGVWNGYNRVPIVLQMTDSTSSYGYSTGTWRQANGSTNNTIVTFNGLAEEWQSFSYRSTVAAASSGAAGVAVAINSTSTPSGVPGTIVLPNTLQNEITGTAALAPPLGINNINPLEVQVSGTLTWNGTYSQGSVTSTAMMLSANWRG